jgi:O-antigen/teichoic acid export membrane protein
LKFIRDLFITFSTQITVVALGFGTVILISRVLGPEGQGAYSLIILIPTLIAMVGNLGIGIANAYFGGKKTYKLPDIAANSIIAAVGFGIILAAGFLVYYFVFKPPFLSDVKSEAVVISTLALPFILLIMYFGYIFLGQNKIKEYNMLGLVQGGTILLLTLLLLLVIQKDVLSPVIAWMGGIILAAALSIWLLLRMTGIGRQFNLSLFKQSVKFGGQGYLGNVMQFLNYRLDMLLVAILMSLEFVGYYSVAVPLAEALWYFSSAVGIIIFARTITLSPEEANKSTPRICRNTLFLTLLAAIILLLLARYIIIIFFGAAFLPALRPLQILLPGVVALSITKVLGNEISGRGKPIINTYIAGTSLAINIPLNLLLIPKIGISGAALASTISYIASAVLCMSIFVKISGVRWTDLIILKAADFQIYRQVLSGVYSTGTDKDKRKLVLQQILLELNPRSWGTLPEQTGIKEEERDRLNTA